MQQAPLFFILTEMKILQASFKSEKVHILTYSSLRINLPYNFNFITEQEKQQCPH